MPPTKKVLRFLALLTLLYVLLVIPWPGWRGAYAAAYRTGSQVLFHSFGSYGTVSFRAAPADAELGDTEVVLKTRMPRLTTVLPLSSRYKGYLPTAAVVALVVATPIHWRRRRWSLLWGLLVVHAFVALRTWLAILNAFVNQGPASQTTSAFWREALQGAAFALAETPASYFIGPILIWIAVSFRSEDWVAADNSRRYTDKR